MTLSGKRVLIIGPSGLVMTEMDDGLDDDARKALFYGAARRCHCLNEQKEKTEWNTAHLEIQA